MPTVARPAGAATVSSRVVTRATGLPAVAAAALFVMLQVPLLSDPTWRHADERRYTDAAVRMLADGDFATPRAADGAPRFHKPLLTYWTLAASFGAFGIGVATSRLPSLLVVLVLAWLVWQTALVWFGQPEIALLAVVILLAHPEVAQLATRATPDALLVCAMTASLLGVARLANRPSPSAHGAFLAWSGAGLAIATKGAPGALCIGYGALALAASGRGRRLIHPAAMAVGAAVALAGTAPAWLRHGAVALSGFHADQLAGREVVHSLGAALDAAARETGSLMLAFLPWTAVLAVGARRIPAVARRRAAFTRFALGWTGLLIVLSSLLEFRRPRYLAPAIPLLAVACAGVLEALTRVGGDAHRRTRVAWLLGLATTWMVAGGVFRGVVRPALSESGAAAVIACLEPEGTQGPIVAVGAQAERMAADVRLLSGGRFDLDVVARPRALAGRTPPAAVVVAGSDVAPQLARLGWRLQPCGREARVRWTLADVRALVATRSAEHVLAAWARGVFVATPPVPYSVRSIPDPRSAVGRHSSHGLISRLPM